eukprot:1339653-Amphidinium_carterae.1
MDLWLKNRVKTHAAVDKSKMKRSAAVTCAAIMSRSLLVWRLVFSLTFLDLSGRNMIGERNRFGGMRIVLSEILRAISRQPLMLSLPAVLFVKCSVNLAYPCSLDDPVILVACLQLPRDILHRLRGAISCKHDSLDRIAWTNHLVPQNSIYEQKQHKERADCLLVSMILAIGVSQTGG